VSGRQSRFDFSTVYLDARPQRHPGVGRTPPITKGPSDPFPAKTGPGSAVGRKGTPTSALHRIPAKIATANPESWFEGGELGPDCLGDRLAASGKVRTAGQAPINSHPSPGAGFSQDPLTCHIRRDPNMGTPGPYGHSGGPKLGPTPGLGFVSVNGNPWENAFRPGGRAPGNTLLPGKVGLTVARSPRPPGPRPEPEGTWD